MHLPRQQKAELLVKQTAIDKMSVEDSKFEAYFNTRSSLRYWLSNWLSQIITSRNICPAVIYITSSIINSKIQQQWLTKLSLA